MNTIHHLPMEMEEDIDEQTRNGYPGRTSGRVL
jgi:hypothetical protein